MTNDGELDGFPASDTYQSTSLPTLRHRQLLRYFVCSAFDLRPSLRRDTAATFVFDAGFMTHNLVPHRFESFGDVQRKRVRIEFADN